MVSSRQSILRFLYLSLLITPFFALENGLARTPAMGWNSWNHFGCDINETVIRQTADNLVSTGLSALGYIYLNIDDCWSVGRFENDTIEADPVRFPSGMKALGDYIHSKGLKFGIYGDAGFETCQKRPGSLFYEDIDAETFASWGVDYLKYDNCYSYLFPPQWRYPRMRNALNLTQKSIYYSLCEWGQDDPWLWAEGVGNSWRTTGDISDNWNSVTSIIDAMAPITQYGSPGGWNDPDMLEVGNGQMTTTEYTSHFSLWAVMKAPLIIGCDITSMSNDTFIILSNQEIIAINQDALGVPGGRVSKNGDQEVWAGPVVDGVAAVLFNRGNSTVNMTVEFKTVGFQGTSANVRDLWAHADLGVFSESYSAEVQPHGVVVVKLTNSSAVVAME